MESDWSVLSEANKNNTGQKNSLLGEAGTEREQNVIVCEIIVAFGGHGDQWVKNILNTLIRF